ncbi:hypothetical protein BC628DRAFT_1415354 [Trametes gibbosa]|nr:hypothetical protein BC628DRAFT_1415354 [Trametes gibbosa]
MGKKSKKTEQTPRKHHAKSPYGKPIPEYLLQHGSAHFPLWGVNYLKWKTSIPNDAGAAAATTLQSEHEAEAGPANVTERNSLSAENPLEPPRLPTCSPASICAEEAQHQSSPPPFQANTGMGTARARPPSMIPTSCSSPLTAPSEWSILARSHPPSLPANHEYPLSHAIPSFDTRGICEYEAGSSHAGCPPAISDQPWNHDDAPLPTAAHEASTVLHTEYGQDMQVSRSLWGTLPLPTLPSSTSPGHGEHMLPSTAERETFNLTSILSSTALQSSLSMADLWPRPCPPGMATRNDISGSTWRDPFTSLRTLPDDTYKYEVQHAAPGSVYATGDPYIYPGYSPDVSAMLSFNFDAPNPPSTCGPNQAIPSVSSVLGLDLGPPSDEIPVCGQTASSDDWSTGTFFETASYIGAPPLTHHSSPTATIEYFDSRGEHSAYATPCTPILGPVPDGSWFGDDAEQWSLSSNHGGHALEDGHVHAVHGPLQPLHDDLRGLYPFPL